MTQDEEGRAPAIIAVTQADRPMQIARTCPKCRMLQDCYYYDVVPAPYGRQTASSVLVQCGNGPCQHQWRSFLRGREAQ